MKFNNPLISGELFNSKKFKMIIAALRRVECDTLRFGVISEFPSNLGLFAYKMNKPFGSLEKFFYIRHGEKYPLTCEVLGINPFNLHHYFTNDGCVDPFDYAIIFDKLIAMNTWIGTASGKTLLTGDGNDIYQLEIEADLH